MNPLKKRNCVDNSRHRNRCGLSMVELLAVVVILGTIAALAVQRFTTSSTHANRNACYMNKGNIEVQAQIWLRNKGSWATVNQMADDQSYFPDGEPTCPIDGTKYQLDPATHLVNGHKH